MDKDHVVPKGIDGENNPHQIHSEVPRSSDGTIELKAPSISRLPAFVPWKSTIYALTLRLYGMPWIWKLC